MRGLAATLGGGTALVLTFAARHALADREPIRLEYAAPAGCPSASQFQRQVFARTSSARLAASSETARAFSIVLERSGAKYEGSLTVYEPDGVSKARTFSGRQCREVALVLALATALAIDPRAELTAVQSEPGDPGLDEALAGGDDNTGALPARDDVPPLVAPTPEIVRPDPYDPPDLPPPPVRTTPYGFGFGLGPRVAVGTAPRPAAGGAVHAAGYARGVLSSYGLELAWLGTNKSYISGAGSEFTFMVARPHLCSVRVALGGRVGLRPCLTAELGSVTGVGSDLPNEQTSRRFWSAVEVALRLDLTVSDPLFLGLDLGVASPLSRYRFVFHTPETSIHDVAPITPVGALLVGLRY